MKFSVTILQQDSKQKLSQMCQFLPALIAFAICSGAYAEPPDTRVTEEVNGLVTPNLTPPNIANCHHLSMRISGSMCITCLKELEKKVKELVGVADAKIDFDAMKAVHYFDAVNQDSAPITVDYDPNQISLQSLRTYLRHKGYRTYKIVDR